MESKLGCDLGTAFRLNNFVEIVRCIAAGGDVNTRLLRGEGIRDTSRGTPLHACCAMSTSRPREAIVLAYLLIAKKANVQAGDGEGDTPLAHAKYFKADAMYQHLERSGAELG